MKSLYKRKWFWLIIILIALIMGSYALFHTPKAPPATVTVSNGTISEQVIASGQIIPNHAIQIKSQIPGIVGDMLVEEGQAVHKDQVLMIVQPNPAPSDYANDYGQVAQYQAQVKQTLATYQRDENLLKQHAIDPNSVDVARKDYEVALASLQQAQANLDLIIAGKAVIANQTVDNRIKSPIDGYVLSKMVDTGDTIVPVTAYQPGTALFVIANMSDLVFQGQVSQIDVGKLKAGMSAKLQVAALPKLALDGKILRVSLQTVQQDNSSSQQNGGTSALFQQQATIQNGFNITINGFTLPADTVLRAGYQATATITVNQVNNVPILPQSAVFYDGDKPYVWLSQNTKITKQYIGLGASDDNNVQIVSGLKLGDSVLLSAPDNDSSS